MAASANGLGGRELAELVVLLGLLQSYDLLDTHPNLLDDFPNLPE